jgi:hypothetical protein
MKSGKWVLLRNNQNVGPLTLDQLRHLANTGQISGNAYIRRVGDVDWIVLSQVLGLQTNPTLLTDSVVQQDDSSSSTNTIYQIAIRLLAQVFVFAITSVAVAWCWHELNIDITVERFKPITRPHGSIVLKEVGKMCGLIGLMAAYVATRIVRSTMIPHTDFPRFSFGFLIGASYYWFGHDNHEFSSFTTGKFVSGIIIGLIAGRVCDEPECNIKPHAPRSICSNNERGQHVRKNTRLNETDKLLIALSVMLVCLSLFNSVLVRWPFILGI